MEGLAQSPSMLNQRALESLLRHLDSDPKTAALKYEEVLNKLLKFFVCNRCLEPEDLADKVIDVAARKAKEGSIQRMDAFLLQVARFVLWEHRRKLARRPLEPIFGELPSESDREVAFHCLEQCVQALSPDSRELILKYYGAEGSRPRVHAQLAQELGINLGTLRTRACRIRAELQRCVRQRLRSYKGGNESRPEDTQRIEDDASEIQR